MNSKLAAQKTALMQLLGCVLIPFVFDSYSPAGADPDFTNVDDILHGERNLLPNDDLVFLGTVSDKSQVVLFNTASGQINAENSLALNDINHEDLTEGNANQVTTGRVFNLKNDVVIAGFAGNGRRGPRILMYDPVQQQWVKALDEDSLDVHLHHDDNMRAQVAYITTSDLNYDGFDEIIAILVSPDQSYDYGLMVGTAKNVNNMQAGIRWTQASIFGIRWFAATGTELSSYGVIELPGQPLGSPKKAVVQATSYDGNSIIIAYLIIDPNSLIGQKQVFNYPGQFTPDAPGGLSSLSLGVGRFGAVDHDQFALAYISREARSGVITFDVNNDGSIKQKWTLDLGVPSALKNPPGRPRARIRTGRLDPTGQFDQAVVSFTASDLTVASPSNYRVFTFDRNLKITQASELTDSTECFSDITLGRFDNRQAAPNDDQPDLNLQLAALYRPWCVGYPSLEIVIYKIDPSKSYAFSSAHYLYVSSTVHGQVKDSLGNLGSFAAGDLQGRSLRLGTPIKLITQETDVQIALQSPPMHVDWALPGDGSAPSVLNLSAAPNDYYTRFITSGTKSITASNTTSIGATLSTSRDNTLTTRVGTKRNYTEVSLSNAVQNELNTVNEATGNTYATQNMDVMSQTGFGDLLWYTDYRRNVYVYPIIGQKGCPASNPDCTSAQQGQAFVQFVGDDQIRRRITAGNILEWFQPVTEPGNVFSYPYDYAQLQRLYPDIAPLTSTSPHSFATDDTVVEQNLQWTQGGGIEQTTSTSNNYSSDVSTSVKGKVKIPYFSEKDQFNVSHSFDLASESAATRSTAMSQSSGIAINKPGLFANPALYSYNVQPYIFGRTLDKNWPNFGAQQGGQIQTHGPLHVAYSVDVSQAGAWWQSGPYRTHPDVALNHPSRWSFPSTAAGSGPDCLGVEEGGNCAVFNAPNLSDLWLSQFHWMRGFYVTPAATQGASPQLLQLTAGQTVNLDARVYNYSLANMKEGSQVKVRFYGQPWNISNNTPSGQNFLIDEKAYSPIPGFGQSPTEPNWIMAETQFDPTPYVNQDLVFWVLVWMEDGSGSMLAELEDHGLTAVPGALNSIQEVPIEAHSNNVGLYRHAFHVFPAGAATAQALKAEPQQKQQRQRRGRTQVVKFRVTPRRNVFQGETVKVELVLRNRHAPVSDLSRVEFYDHNPHRNAPGEPDRPFDIEHVSHLPANRRVSVAVPYTPERCGRTELHATVPGLNIRARTHFNVSCRR